MNTVATKSKNIRFLPFFCIMISIALLLAGLWPFNFFPRNNVRWLPDQEALRFGRYGIAFSPKPFEVSGEILDFRKPIHFELKIRPLGEPDYFIPRILSICDDQFRELFSVGQWKNNLIIRLANLQGSSSESYCETGVDNLIRKDEPVILGINSDNSGLSVFANDKLVLQKTDYSLSRLSGLRTQALLVLGNSPTGDSPWKGDLLGFSIRQDTERTQNPQSNAMTFAHTKKESGAFLQTGGKVPLEFFIPSTYRPVKKTILLPPWKEPNYNHSFWKDVFVNILGFIPFGFFFYAWLRESSTEKNFST